MSDLTDNVLPCTKIDPTEYDATINSILIGIQAEKYIDIFKKRNIGQSTLAELSDEDLIRLGVDDAAIRRKIQSAARNLPTNYVEANHVRNYTLNSTEIIEVINESTKQLHNIYLSLGANVQALRKAKQVTDCLLHKDKYASNIAVTTLSEMNSILNSMDVALHKQLKGFRAETSYKNKKKIVVGAMGSAVIAVLSVLFISSLKQLK